MGWGSANKLFHEVLRSIDHCNGDVSDELVSVLIDDFEEHDADNLCELEDEWPQIRRHYEAKREKKV